MHRLIILTVVVLLTSCGTIRPTTWYNTGFSDSSARERQLTIDDAHCSLVADGAAPMPEPRVYVPQQQVYTINTRVTTYGQGGPQTSNVYGTVTGGPAPSFASGFADGYALGASIKARMRAKELQAKTYIACMYKLGWSDKPIAAQASSAESLFGKATYDEPKK